MWQSYRYLCTPCCGSQRDRCSDYSPQTLPHNYREYNTASAGRYEFFQRLLRLYDGIGLKCTTFSGMKCATCQCDNFGESVPLWRSFGLVYYWIIIWYTFALSFTASIEKPAPMKGETLHFLTNLINLSNFIELQFITRFALHQHKSVCR